jgi:hypothetical protein
MNIDKLAETLTAIGIAAIIVAVVLGALASCSTPQPIVQTEVKEVIVEREVRDTIVTIAPDSASIKALLECDSAGNVLINELEEVQGKNVSLALALKNMKGKPATLSVDCKQDSLERVIALQNEKIQELNNNKQTETIEVKYIPSFVKWLAWVGAGAILLAVLWVVLKVHRRFVLKV